MDGVSSSEGSQHPPLLQQGDRFSETKIFVTDTNTLKKVIKDSILQQDNVVLKMQIHVMCIVNVKYWSTSASMLWRRVFMTISSFFASHDCSRLTITIVGWKSRNIRLSMAPTMRQLFAVNSNAIFVQHVFVLFQTWGKEIEDVRSFKSENLIIMLLMVDHRWKETLWKQSVLRIGAVLPFAIWWV